MLRFNQSVVAFLALFAAATFVTPSSGTKKIVATAEVAQRNKATMKPGILMLEDDFSTVTAGPVTSYNSKFGATETDPTVTATYSVGNFLTRALAGGIKGSGFYLQTQTGGTTTITLSRPLQYFGMWISSLKTGGITVKFHKGPDLVEEFSAADILALLTDASYTTNPHSDVIEANTYFGFVNFLCTAEYKFDKIEIIAGATFPVNTAKHTIGYQMNLIVTTEAASVVTKTTLPDYTLGLQDFNGATADQSLTGAGVTLSFAAGQPPVSGAYTTAGKIAGHDVDGGVDKTGNYLRTEGGVNGAITTLTVSRPLQYFGMWMSKFHKEDLTLKFYDGPDLVQELPGIYVWNIVRGDDESKANPRFKNPNAGLGPPTYTALYSFVNFVAADKVRFDTVKIIAAPNKIACTDNHTIGFKTVLGAAKIEVSAEAAKATATTKTGYDLGVETFDAADVADTTLMSTFEGRTTNANYKEIAILSNGVLGGVAPDGKFLKTASGTTTTLIAGKQLQYFGMWISNLKDGLTVKFFDRETEVQSFTTSDIIRLLKGSSAYRQNPNENNAEKADMYFGFVNFACVGASKFTKIEISATRSSHIYTDNHTIGIKTRKMDAFPLAPSVTVPGSLGFGAVLGTQNFDTASANLDISKAQLQTPFASDMQDAGLAGTYTMGGVIKASDNTKGVGTTGNFLETAAGKSTVLTSTKDLKYFGMWISKLQEGLTVKFYDGTTLVQEFSSDYIIDTFGDDPKYKENPDTQTTVATDGYFAFVGFRSSGAEKFNKVEIAAATNPVYTDNHAIAYFPIALEPSVEEPEVYETLVPGYTTGVETFDDVSTGATTLTATFERLAPASTYAGLKIVDHNANGGAGGTGRYLETAAGTITTFTAAKSLNYFGMWVSQLKGGLTVNFYDGDTGLQRFTTSDIIDVFKKKSSVEYNKNPHDGKKSVAATYFGFINFVCTAGKKFNKVEIIATGTSIYTDNHTIGLMKPTPAKITVAMENAGVTTTKIAGYTTGIETFDTASAATLNLAFGDVSTDASYTGLKIIGHDVNGGVGKTGKYLETVGATTTVLTSTKDLHYFGMWISKLKSDSGLTVKFGHEGTEVQTFTTSDIIKLIRAAKNVEYTKNPNADPITAEPGTYYGFVNFACAEKNKFNKIEISGATGKSIYTDNHTVGVQKVPAKMEAKVESPKATVTTLTKFITGIENFDAATVGEAIFKTSFGLVSTDGIYPNAKIVARDDNGGVGTTGKYIVTQPGMTTSLISSKNLHYFGMWISKLTGGLSVKFFHDEKDVHIFSTNDIIKLMKGPKTEEYTKNPNVANSAAVAGTYYGFLNFACTGENRFNRVEITAAPGTTIYTDNHTVGIKKPGTPKIAINLESPGAATTTKAGDYVTGVENFNKATAGSTELESAFGDVLTDGMFVGMKVKAHDNVGGSGKTGGNYMETEPQMSTTLLSNKDLQYFGMWISKFTEDLIVRFFHDENDVQIFSTSDLIKLFKQAKSPTEYTKNPNIDNSPAVEGTYYGFINFNGVGNKFNRVEIISLGPAIYTDNHTVGIAKGPPKVATTVEAPKVYQTTVTGYTKGVENFDAAGTDAKTLTSAFGTAAAGGTYTGVTILEHDVNGGVGKTGKYLGTEPRKPTVLTSGKYLQYFGMWISKLTGGLTLRFTDGTSVLHVVSTNDILKLLKDKTNAVEYTKNPNVENSSAETGTYYVFLNFEAAVGRKFNKVTIISEKSLIYTDNHTVGYTAIQATTPPAPKKTTKKATEGEKKEIKKPIRDTSNAMHPVATAMTIATCIIISSFIQY